MSGQLLSSKIVFREEEPKVRISSATSGTVIGLVGLTERGPIGEAVLCTAEEFRRRFGGYTRDSRLSVAIDGLFANSNTPVWVVRTGHYDDVSDPESLTAKRASGNLQSSDVAAPATVESNASGPFQLKPGDRLAVEVDAGGIGATVFWAEAASVVNTAMGPFALTDGDTLTLKLDDGGEQTITFNEGDFADISQATEEEVAAVLNAQLTGGRAIAGVNP